MNHNENEEIARQEPDEVHDKDCPRNQFWDAGEYECPCYCFDDDDEKDEYDQEEDYDEEC